MEACTLTILTVHINARQQKARNSTFAARGAANVVFSDVSDPSTPAVQYGLPGRH